MNEPRRFAMNSEKEINVFKRKAYQLKKQKAILSFLLFCFLGQHDPAMLYFELTV
jgi:hypothetical protein